jgi:hypothetical protein
MDTGSVEAKKNAGEKRRDVPLFVSYAKKLAIVRPDAKLRPASKSHWMNTPIRERTI